MKGTFAAMTDKTLQAIVSSELTMFTLAMFWSYRVT